MRSVRSYPINRMMDMAMDIGKAMEVPSLGLVIHLSICHMAEQQTPRLRREAKIRGRSWSHPSRHDCHVF
jgi:hypothetical protein